MFYTFVSREERGIFGGGNFIEFQYCRLSPGTPLKEIIAVDSIQHWLNDSMYVHDENQFYNRYGRIFDCGIYNNFKSGAVDIYGINYYSPGTIDAIVEKLENTKPDDYKTLLIWLEKAKAFNGIYILGLWKLKGRLTGRPFCV